MKTTTETIKPKGLNAKKVEYAILVSHEGDLLYYVGTRKKRWSKSKDDARRYENLAKARDARWHVENSYNVKAKPEIVQVPPRVNYNCFVRAIGYLEEVDYDSAMLLAIEKGYESRVDIEKKGMPHRSGNALLKSVGAERLYYRSPIANGGPWLTVGRAIKEKMQKGRFLVRIEKHAFAVVDGKIINDHIEETSRKQVKEIHRMVATEIRLSEEGGNWSMAI